MATKRMQNAFKTKIRNAPSSLSSIVVNSEINTSLCEDQSTGSKPILMGSNSAEVLSTMGNECVVLGRGTGNSHTGK